MGLMKIHEDKRRTLMDWGAIAYKWAICKTIIAKEDCLLGRHYHKRKTELFMLVSGSATLTTGYPHLSRDNTVSMEVGKEYKVSPLTTHTFRLRKGTIMNCLADREYDATDDYEI